MSATAIYASRILTPQDELRDCVIIVEAGRITGIGHRDEVHIPPGAKDYVASGMTVVPGFVDVHIHGAGGHDVMEADVAALDKITATVARFGTTSIVATTVTAPVEATCHSLEGIAHYIRAHENAVAAIHRSPRLIVDPEFGLRDRNGAPRRGVHPTDSILAPSVETFEKFRAAAGNLVKIITIAPEMPGALKLIAAAVADGVVVGLGHTDADYAQARAAIGAGARHAVHVYNAMRPFTHRDPGVISAVLTDADVTAEIIADGVHVAGPAIQVLLGTKGFDTVLLVSDGTAATGMRDGTFKLGGFDVQVRDGVVRNSEGKLAGSTLTIDRAIRYLVDLGVPVVDAIRMATILPARRLGLAGKKGIIAVGADADLVILTPDLHVAGVMTRGVGLA